MDRQPTPEDAAAQIEPPEPPDADEAVSIILEKLTDWGESAVASLPNLLLAIVVLIVFWIVSRLVRRGLSKALERTPMATPIRRLATTLAGLGVLAVGIFLALGALGLDRTVTSLLAGVGIIGLALGFAFQDIAANLMSGVILSFRRPINVGDLVETNDFFGTVEEINLRATVIRRPAGQLVFVPNKAVLESPMINYNAAPRRRVDLGVGVSYGDDLEKARRVTIAAVEGVEGRVEDEPVELFFEEFGGSSINLIVRFWIDFERQGEYLAARSDAIVRIKKAYDENGLTIPFPIRTLDFGIVGGEPLSSQLAAAGSKAPAAGAD